MCFPVAAPPPPPSFEGIFLLQNEVNCIHVLVSTQISLERHESPNTLLQTTNLNVCGNVIAGVVDRLERLVHFEKFDSFHRQLILAFGSSAV